MLNCSKLVIARYFLVIDVKFQPVLVAGVVKSLGNQSGKLLTLFCIVNLGKLALIHSVKIIP